MRIGIRNNANGEEVKDLSKYLDREQDFGENARWQKLKKKKIIKKIKE